MLDGLQCSDKSEKETKKINVTLPKCSRLQHLNRVKSDDYDDDEDKCGFYDGGPSNVVPSTQGTKYCDENYGDDDILPEGEA